MIICAGESESFDFAKPMGIGLINTSINLTKAFLFAQPERVLFIGTAGSYGRCKIGDIVESSKSTNVEIGYFQKFSYSPLDNSLSDVSRETLEDKIVNSSNYITTDEQRAKEFLSAGLDIENMEFFAVMNVAKKFQIPVRGIFYVTNYCNANAHEEFMKNHKKAKECLSEYVEKNYKRAIDEDDIGFY